MFDKCVLFGLSGIALNVNKNWEDVVAYTSNDDFRSYSSIVLPEVQPSARGDLARCDAFNQYQEGRLTKRAYFDELVKFLWDDATLQTFELFGAVYSSLTSMEKELVRATIGEEAHVRILRDEPVDGAGALSYEMSEKEVDFGFIANTDETHYPLINRKFAYLGNSTCSFKVGHRKPSQEIFEACVTLGKPVVYFDTNLDNIEAAKKFGWWNSHHISSPTPIEDIRKVLDREVNLSNLKVYDAYNDV